MDVFRRCHLCSVAASEQALYDAMDNVVCVFDDIEFRIDSKLLWLRTPPKRHFGIRLWIL